MQGEDANELFEQIRSAHPNLPTIIITADQSVPRAIDATQKGVFAYLPKPVDEEALLLKIAAALAPKDGRHSGPALSSMEQWRDELLTRSAVMNQLMQEAMQVARSESSVLILGNSGTGKELLAQVMHKASNRSDGPFVAVNCTAIPESLFESELFGHKKGSFTGANEDREGLIAAANQGSLMLDEIGDMPLVFQAKLLRVLQEKEIRPVGSTTSVPIDVRVISATHHDLDAEVAAGSFRDDLYYRLNVVTLEMPSLADRREDIPLLANHFLKELADNRDFGTHPISGFAEDAMERLVTARWPGNIRQLHNVVEQCVVLTTAPLISDQLVKRALRSKTEQLQSFSSARNQFEFQYLLNLLHTTQGNVTQAAKMAQRNRSEFYKLLRKHHLVPDSFRDEKE